MTLFLSNRDGNGKTSEEGHLRFASNTYTGNVLAATDFAVTQQDTLAMGVKIAPGTYRIPDLTGSFAYLGWSDANTNVSIPTADGSNPRISAIVIYIDKTAPTSASPANNPGIAKFLSVNGTPAAVPVIPTNSQIQSAVGAGNPYIILASVRVPASASNVVNAYITDLRSFVAVNAGLVNTDSLQDSAISTSKINTNAVTATKLSPLSATTSKVAPNYIIVNGSTGTTSRQGFPSANATYTVQGTSFTYTTGTTPELLQLSADALIIQSGAAGEFVIADNGVPVGKSDYSDQTFWIKRRAEALYPVPANTTVNISTQFRTGNTGGGSVCNSTSDQSKVASYGCQIRMIAWGRT